MRLLKFVKSTFYKYRSSMFLKVYIKDFHPNNYFLRKVPMYAYTISKEDAKEFFDQYDTFYYFTINEISKLGNGLKILDVGGKKLANAILSLKHEVNAIVLKNPDDKITKVKWIIHDVSDPLPFDDGYFDVFISPSTLHLIGLNRYGDKLNPNALINFTKELDRVMKKENAHLFLSLPLGKTHLLFNFHYIFDFDFILELFRGWVLVEFFVDEWVHFNRSAKRSSPERFSKNVDTSTFKKGEYKVIYLHFKR